MTKKIISVILALITVISVFTVTSTTAFAASYSTGKFTVSASNGVNVRSGAGTNYSKVGAASKGIKFNVSKTSGS